VGRREILGEAERVVDYDEMGYREEQTKALVCAITYSTVSKQCDTCTLLRCMRIE
jgi:hypothetical protein